MLIGPARTPGYGVFKGIEELPMGYCGYFDKDNALKKMSVLGFCRKSYP